MWLKLNKQDLGIDVIPFLLASDENFKATGSLSQHVIKKVVEASTWVKIGVVDQHENRSYPVSSYEKSVWLLQFPTRELKSDQEMSKIINTLSEF